MGVKNVCIWVDGYVVSRLCRLWKWYVHLVGWDKTGQDTGSRDKESVSYGLKGLFAHINSTITIQYNGQQVRIINKYM